MDGFKRPTNRKRTPQLPGQDPSRLTSIPKQRPVELPKPEEFEVNDEKPSITKKLGFSRSKAVLAGAIGLAVLTLIVLMSLYSFLLSPRDTSAKDTMSVEIVSGMLPAQIASKLEESGVIRSRLAFTVHTRLKGTQNSLQAGSYQLSPASSTPEIAVKLQGGPGIDEIEVMFKPGATLSDNKKVLMELGYSGEEIDSAFNASYNHKLLEGRPKGSDLEGYIFGETHRFAKGSTVREILERYFDDYYAVIEENNLVGAYREQGLSLFEGITLASIIQRESGGDDKAGIAQVFLLRLSIGMQLGSDVTYQYIADKEGKPRDVNYDSAYNTRRYEGLPPGPIASPGVDALKAVASPAEGDYLYFLSGDDDITYFARTFAEHEANIGNHCRSKCTII